MEWVVGGRSGELEPCTQVLPPDGRESIECGWDCVSEHKGLVRDKEHKGAGLGGKGAEAEPLTELPETLTLTSPGLLGAGGKGEVLEQGAGGCQVLGVSSWYRKGRDSSREK